MKAGPRTMGGAYGVEFRSNVDGRLLHVWIRAVSLPAGRFDISDPVEPLQISVIAAPAGTEYAAHRHISKPTPSEHVTQETWIVVRGRVEVRYFDIDGEPLGTAELEAGDCTITYRGGHGYRILTDDARVYEVKSGPYLGHDKDKVAL